MHFGKLAVLAVYCIKKMISNSVFLSSWNKIDHKKVMDGFCWIKTFARLLSQAFVQIQTAQN